MPDEPGSPPIIPTHEWNNLAIQTSYIGELWVQPGDSAAMNKPNIDGGRLLTSTLDFFMHPQIHVCPHICEHPYMHAHMPHIHM